MRSFNSFRDKKLNWSILVPNVNKKSMKRSSHNALPFPNSVLVGERKLAMFKRMMLDEIGTTENSYA
ncbi:hypothetical protein Hamer_G012500 [Homarus americanus]|uniref:Uncharacterized protein n=1 Tax=Homarus americanus TaxID=6706 RepID=A0A8J5N0X8_HOMAM|nr:hypothetical protein Hamer_G012500 [Homarus americanus]